MLFLSLILPLFLPIRGVFGAAVLDKRTGTTCAADNCARAVTGTATAPPLSSRKADCSSFLRRTVTPDPVYVIIPG